MTMQHRPGFGAGFVPPGLGKPGAPKLGTPGPSSSAPPLATGSGLPGRRLGTFSAPGLVAHVTAPNATVSHRASGPKIRGASGQAIAAHARRFLRRPFGG